MELLAVKPPQAHPRNTMQPIRQRAQQSPARSKTHLSAARYATMQSGWKRLYWYSAHTILLHLPLMLLSLLLICVKVKYWLTVFSHYCELLEWFSVLWFNLALKIFYIFSKKRCEQQVGWQSKPTARKCFAVIFFLLFRCSVRFILPQQTWGPTTEA